MKKKKPVILICMLILAGAFAAPAQDQMESTEEEQVFVPLVTTEPLQYTVEAGDTLMGIARKAYGESSGWRAIYQENRDQLEQAGGLKEGLVITLPVRPQESSTTASASAAIRPQSGNTPFARADTTVQQRLESSLAELNALREKIVMEKIPLSRKLRDLEDHLIEVRREYQQTSRLLDSRTLDLSNLRSEIKSRRDEKNYLSNLLNEYIRNFESRLHIAELHRYADKLEAAKLAPENSNLSDLEIYRTQADLVAVSLDRLDDALGGTRFKGAAVDSHGSVKQGSFVLLGPAALFRSEDGESVGTAEQRLGSLEPTVIGFEKPADAKAAADLVLSASGQFPLDPTLGNAHKIEATKQTLWEHISKGGVVMAPILGLAAAALLVALYKWIQLARLRKPSEEHIRVLLNAVAEHDREKAAEEAAAIGGPAGEMLVIGVGHIKEPRELIEEVMYEKMLSTRLKLQSFLPFIAITASSAPLLGLLGTVTGIINTFKLITVFGSGDVKTLSGGISEALVTTEFGLIVAIPSLLIHAFLSRKARGVTDQMEKAAVTFMNQLSKTPYKHTKGAA
jgi:biopolymer transport protein ExbB